MAIKVETGGFLEEFRTGFSGGTTTYGGSPETSVYLSTLITGGVVTQANIDSLGTTVRKELIVNVAAEVNANLIIPSNIYVSYEGVGIWKVAAVATLTIRWMQDVGHRLLFTNIGTQAIGNVAFGANAVSAFRLAWWTGTATSGTYSTAMANIISSMHTNLGGVCFLPAGDFTFEQTYNPPSSSVFKGSGCTVTGFYAAPTGGGTTLRFTTANSQLFYVGSLTQNTPNNQRSIRFEDLSISLSGAALTTSVGLLVSGGGNPQQNIYGVECRNVAFNGGKYCVNVGMTAAAQVENVNFDHCFFIGGAEACFRLQTRNGTTNFTQPYFSALADKDCVRIHDCGLFTMSNAHGVGPGTTATTRARAFIYFAYDTTTVSGTLTGTGIDKANVTLIGCQDENVKYSILTEAAQPDYPTTLIGNTLQGLCKILGTHHFDCTGNNFIARAWRDGLHPVIKDAAGAPLKGDGRVSISSDTFTSDYLDEATWALSLGVTPRGQAEEFTQFSQISYQHDTQQNAIYTRVTARFFQTNPKKWIGFEPHKTGQVQIFSDEPNRAAIQIGNALVVPDEVNATTGASLKNKRTETILANYSIFRATNKDWAAEGYLGIFSSQLGTSNSQYRGVETNGTWKGNGLNITADLVNGFDGNASIAGTLAVAKFQVNQPVTAPGTISNAAGGTIVTGGGTTFLTTFRAGDRIIIKGVSQIVATVDTDLQLTTTTAITAANNAGTAYTTGGSERFRIDNSGAATGLYNAYNAATWNTSNKLATERGVFDAVGSGGGGGPADYKGNVKNTSINAPSDGAADATPSINTYVNTTLQAAGSIGGEVFFPEGKYLFGSNIQFPANVRLTLPFGARLIAGNGATVKLPPNFNAGAYQVFETVGTGKFVFEGPLPQDIFPEWFGAKGDGTTDDILAFEKMLAAVPPAGNGYKTAHIILGLGKTYYLSRSLHNDHAIYMESLGSSGWSNTAVLKFGNGGGLVMHSETTRNGTHNGQTSAFSVLKNFQITSEIPPDNTTATISGLTLTRASGIPWTVQNYVAPNNSITLNNFDYVIESITATTMTLRKPRVIIHTYSGMNLATNYTPYRYDTTSWVGQTVKIRGTDYTVKSSAYNAALSRFEYYFYNAGTIVDAVFPVTGEALAEVQTLATQTTPVSLRMNMYPALKIHTSITVDGVYIRGCAGNGIDLDNRTGTNGGVSNNNSFHINRVMVYHALGSGIITVGQDSNAGNISFSDFSFNGIAGIMETSFLGNQYWGNHTSFNHFAAIMVLGGVNASLFNGNYSEGGQGSEMYLSGLVLVQGGFRAAAPRPDESVATFVDGNHGLTVLGAIRPSKSFGVSLGNIITTYGNDHISAQIGMNAQAPNLPYTSLLIRAPQNGDVPIILATQGDSATYTFAASEVNLANNTLTKAGSGIRDAVPLRFPNGAPTPLVAGRTYYTVNSDGNTFQLATAAQGQPLDFTAATDGSFVVDGAAERLRVQGVGIVASAPVTIKNLAGTDVRMVTTDATGLLGFAALPSGGGTGGVTLDTAQTITGLKSFTGGGVSLGVFNANTTANATRFFGTTGPNGTFNGNSSTGVDNGASGMGIINSADGASQGLGFYTHRSGSQSAQKAFITPTGNFLIGTPTDDGVNKLQINGNVSITGNLTVTGTSPGGGGTAAGVTLDTVQTITGLKTFTGGGVSLGAFNANTTAGAIRFFGTTDSAGGTFNGNNTAGAQNGASGMGIINSADGASQGLGFYTHKSGSQSAQKAFITPLGNFLIGTPAEITDNGTNKLQVSGSGLFTGAVTLGTGSTAINKVLRGTVSIDPTPVAANTAVSQSFALPGAIMGDSLVLNPPGLAGLLVLQCRVSAADQITITFENKSAAAIDEPAGSWIYRLER